MWPFCRDLSWALCQVLPDYNAVVQHHGLMTSVVGLNFEVMPHHFLSGHMQIRCVATISTTQQHGHHDRALPLEDNREVFLLSRHEQLVTCCGRHTVVDSQEQLWPWQWRRRGGQSDRLFMTSSRCIPKINSISVQTRPNSLYYTELHVSSYLRLSSVSQLVFKTY
jgi:hypothetical protein